MYSQVNTNLKSFFTKKISVKIFLSFFFIIAAVALISAWTIFALNRFEQLQNEFSNQAIDYLRNLQEFSNVVSSYLVLVERLPKSGELPADIQQRIFEQKEHSLKYLADLNSARQTREKQQVRALLQQIFVQVEERMSIQNNRLRAFKNNNEIALSDIYEALKRIENAIKRFEIAISIQAGLNNTQTQYNAAIIEATAQLRLTLSLSLPIDGNTNLAAVRRRFVDATTTIVNNNALITDSQTRTEISKSVTLLLKAIEPKLSFFQQLEDIRDAEARIFDLIESNYELESQFNVVLAQLVSEANAQTRSDLNALTALAQADANRSIFGLVLSLITSILIIFLFIQPQIIRRLRRLADDTSMVAAGHLTRTIESSGDDEIADMSRALDNFRKQLILKDEIESQVRENEALLSNIVANAADGLMTLDADGKILSFNQACERIFERKGKRLIGLSADLVIAGFTRGPFQAFKLDAGNNHAAHASEQVGLRPSVDNFPLEMSMSEVKMADHTIYLCILRDISERKRHQAEREALINSLNASNTQLSQFAYVCSHDLQEPMRMISAFSDRLEKRVQTLAPELLEDERFATYLGQLTKGAVNGQALIKDILSYSKLDHDKQAFEQVDCHEIVQEVRNILDPNDKGLIQIKEPLPIVRAIRTQMHQLFLNLISNGLKYVEPECQPQVSVNVTESKTHWILAFQDNGIGIDPKNFDAIFQMFRRLHRKDEFLGTGIGLTICKKIVDNHQGEISVDSAPGKGSTFKVTLLKSEN